MGSKRHDYHSEVRNRDSETKYSDEEYRSSRDVDHHHHHHKYEMSTKISRRRSRSRSSSRSKSDKHNRSRSRSRSRSQSPHRSHKHKKDSYRRHHHGSSSSRKHSDYSSRGGGGGRDYERDRIKRNRSRSKSKEKLNIYGEKSDSKSVNIPPMPEKEKNFSAPKFDPSKLVEQVEKRKLLFSKKDTPETSTAAWKQTSFQDDSDGKMTAKFKRLMGIKEKEGPSEKPEKEKEGTSTKQNDYFEKLEMQYEVARATTHTQRGKGLGFGSLSFMHKPGE